MSHDAFRLEQLDDLTLVLYSFAPSNMILDLLRGVLGRDAEKLVANSVQNTELLARAVVEELHKADRVMAAIQWLRQGRPPTKLQSSLDHILNGGTFGTRQQLQAFVNEHEPFWSSDFFISVYPKLVGRICAICLGDPYNRPVGTGFLIDADLVMTNFHVLKDVLQCDPVTMRITHKGDGKNLHFIFDFTAGRPPTIPPDRESSNYVSVCAAPDWLVHARKMLPYDGTATCPAVVDTEYDYAVVRLAEPIGNRPTRRSGGELRGSMTLHDDIDVLTERQALVLIQHPEGSQQRLSFGEFIRLDQTKTRVWYNVSSAHGSSGGAALDTQGKLFAIHNATLDEDVFMFQDRRVNQGIRIDYVYRDFKAASDRLPDAHASGQEPVWSLTDDLKDPQPVIGRAEFCRHVFRMQAEAQGTPRVLTVAGPAGSGRKFSIDLLRRIVGAQVPIVEFSEQSLQQSTPREFIQILLTGLMVDADVRQLPEQPTTEAYPRWLRQDLPAWLAARLAEDQQKNRATYPRWVVINTVVPEGRRLLWAEQLRDFLVALMGASDRGQPGVQLAQLRWLILGEYTDAMLLGDIPRLNDDLSDMSKLDEELVVCVKLAQKLQGRALKDGDEAGLRFAARAVISANVGAPRRYLMARIVSEYLKAST